MTAKEEDILTSENLIKKGIAIEKLINSLIVTPGITNTDLILGDRNAVMVASRILAYGPEYVTQMEDPMTGELVSQTFDLTDCPFKELPEDVDYSTNVFDFTLPTTKTNIQFRLLNGQDEKVIENSIKAMKKVSSVSPQLTTRLKSAIVSVDGEENKQTISNFVDNMLSRDSLALRTEIQRISPDIELTQEVDLGGRTVEVTIPMTVNFFWPSAK